jgi:Cd2+/Zn2+-exporting ATPase
VTNRQLFRVRGLDCAAESAQLRRELEDIPGIDALAFDPARGRMVVTGTVAREEIAAAVARTGMRAEPWTDAEESRRVLTVTTALSGAAVLAGLAARLGGAAAWPFLLLAVAAGIWHVVPRALGAARHLRPDMHLLMCVAIAGAIGIGEWIEAASVAFLYSLSLALEAWSVGRARRAVEELLALAPATATLLDGERTLPAEEVEPGSRILVRPGERVPLDGIVRDGESGVDQSPLTGESLPVGKQVGDEVYAGCINGEGALVVETTKAADETTMAHMVRMVELAGEKRSAHERWVERFARVYTPAVMLLAVLVLVTPPLLFGLAWGESFYRALVLLVIACPCALVISTPVSIVAGLTSAARHGVLVKGGDHLETPARLGAIALDKTGTLTQGRPQVVEVVAYNDHSEEEVLARAAALDARSAHPIARAIVAAARERGTDPLPASSVTVRPGKGAEGLVDGRPFWVGSHRFLDELRGPEHDAVCARMEELAGPGRSVLFVGHEDHVCGLIAVADAIRPDAADQIAALKREGIEPVVMLTGDNRPTAEAIGRAVGVTEVRAELLPAQKLTAIEELGERHGTVAMVGDGINDAPAMARSDLGIAMGAAGSDAAIETADIALMADDLSRLPWLVRHSRRTLTIIRQNVAAALLVKAAFVILTFLGGASLWAAIAADMGVSLAVVANALRLLRT